MVLFALVETISESYDWGIAISILAKEVTWYKVASSRSLGPDSLYLSSFRPPCRHLGTAQWQSARSSYGRRGIADAASVVVSREGEVDCTFRPL